MQVQAQADLTFKKGDTTTTQAQAEVTFKKGDTTTTLRPCTGEYITQALYNIQETGMPSREDLDLFGDKIWDIIEATKKTVTNDKKTSEIVSKAQDIVNDFKDVVEEINYDNKIQDVAKKIKDEITPNPKNITNIAKDVAVIGKEAIDDTEKIKQSLKDIMPLLSQLSKSLVSDYEFRDILITILDIVQSSYSRLGESLEEPSVIDAMKDDLEDTENTTPDRTKEAFKKKIKNMKKYTALTEEEKDELINKFSSALKQLKSHEEYQSLFENIFKIYDSMISMWSCLKNNPNLEETYSEGSSILNDIKEIIERASSRSMDRFIELAQDLNEVINDDMYKEMRSDLENLIFDKDRTFESEEDIKEMYNKIKNSFQELNEKYNDLLEELFYEVREIVNGISNDKYISKIGKDINELFKVIFTDSKGKPTVVATAESMLKIKDLFLPIIKGQIEHFVLPIIDIESENYFFRLSNFKLNMMSLLPEQIKIDNNSSIEIDTVEMKRSGYFNLVFSINSISSDIEHLNFFLRKKHGIKFTDYGTVNLHLRDGSLSFAFRFKLEADRVDYLELSSISCDVSGLKIDVLESKHDVIDTIATTVFLPVVRGRLKYLIETRLYEFINDELICRLNDGLRRIEK
jgi:gas vesicle protein